MLLQNDEMSPNVVILMLLDWWQSLVNPNLFMIFVFINAFHAAGECRRQVKNLTNVVKNVKIDEFHDHI